MKLIDFDEKFSVFILDWLKAHEESYKNYDDMEDDIPHIYQHFVSSPMDYLDGQSPREFFSKFEDFDSIIKLVRAYTEHETSIPDLLIERLYEVASDFELERLIGDENQEIAMLAIDALRGRGSLAALDKYLELAFDENTDSALFDSVIESLDEIGEASYDRLMLNLPFANDRAKLGFISILSKQKGNETLFKEALSLFVKRRDFAQELSSYISRLDDERALPLLIERAGDSSTGYIDYIELRNAIESLGGEAPEREFDENQEYLED